MKINKFKLESKELYLGSRDWTIQIYLTVKYGQLMWVYYLYNNKMDIEDAYVIYYRNYLTVLEVLRYINFPKDLRYKDGLFTTEMKIKRLTDF